MPTIIIVPRANFSETFIFPDYGLEKYIVNNVYLSNGNVDKSDGYYSIANFPISVQTKSITVKNDYDVQSSLTHFFSDSAGNMIRSTLSQTKNMSNYKTTVPKNAAYFTFAVSSLLRPKPKTIQYTLKRVLDLCAPEHGLLSLYDGNGKLIY